MVQRLPSLKISNQDSISKDGGARTSQSMQRKMTVKIDSNANTGISWQDSVPVEGSELGSQSASKRMYEKSDRLN